MGRLRQPRSEKQGENFKGSLFRRIPHIGILLIFIAKYVITVNKGKNGMSILF